MKMTMEILQTSSEWFLTNRIEKGKIRAMTKYPNINVDLSRVDGNAFSIMGAVTRAMRSHGLSYDEEDAYRKEATSGDYNHLLITTGNWVNIVFSDYDDDCEDDYDSDDFDYDELDDQLEELYD